MTPTYSSSELRGEQLLASTRLPPRLSGLIDDLARRTRRNRADIVRTIVLRHFVATREVILSDPRDAKL